MASLRLSLLGPPAVERAGAPVTAFRSDKERALLAFLALEADRPHRREALAALLWGGLPDGAALRNLRKALHGLRRALGDGVLRASAKTVQFNPDGDAFVDALEFAGRLERVRAHRHRSPDRCRACRAWLRQAADLYRGDLLQGFSLPADAAFDEWLVVARERLRLQVLAALARLAAMAERAGDLEALRDYAARMVSLEPWNEAARRQSMRALAGSGQRAAAAAQYEAGRRALAEELGLEPEAETTRLYEQIRAGTFPAPSAPAPARGNLPAPPTPFIGRAEELRLLDERLSDPDYRLVTLAGAGGVGKTRLALRAAQAAEGDFADGAWFIPLAGVALGVDQASHANLLASAVGLALGVEFTATGEPQAQLPARLREREALLVLDNLDELSGAAAYLAQLLRECPGLALLATARAPLNLQAEYAVRVEGLPVPAADEAQPQAFDSVRLFLERAERARPGLPLGDDLLDAARQVCRLVDGLPLGIELAAAWAGRRPPGEMASALRASIDFLRTDMPDVDPRHRSLRAVFEESWRRLPENLQAILAQASVFRGGFTPEAAQRVIGAGEADLWALAAQSLLRQGADGRCDMHDLLRRFAAEKLEQAGGLAARHAACYLDFLAQREEALFGRAGKTAAAEARRELDNLRRAWRWAAEGAHIDDLLRGLTGLSRFYELAGLYGEAAEAFALAAGRVAALPAAGRDGRAQEALARLLLEQAHMVYLQGALDRAAALSQQAADLAARASLGEVEARAHTLWGAALMQQGRPEAGARLAEALRLAQAAGAPLAEAEALTALGFLHFVVGDPRQAQEQLEQAARLFHDLGHAQYEGMALANLIAVAHARGDIAGAWAAGRDALALSRETGSRTQEILALPELGALSMRLGDLDAGHTYLDQALALARAAGMNEGEVNALSGLGAAAALRGDFTEAEALCQEALSLAREQGFQRWEAMILNDLGRALEGLGRPAEAREAYRRALELQQAAGMLPQQLGALAGLARLALAEGDNLEAMRLVEDVLARAETGGLALADEPFPVYLACYHVLAANGDPRASGVLREAAGLLRERAAAIADERLRAAFVENIPAHREIARLAKGSGGWKGEG